jgi:hypothetical protein
MPRLARAIDIEPAGTRRGVPRRNPRRMTTAQSPGQDDEHRLSTTASPLRHVQTWVMYPDTLASRAALRVASVTADRSSPRGWRAICVPRGWMLLFMSDTLGLHEGKASIHIHFEIEYTFLRID